MEETVIFRLSIAQLGAECFIVSGGGENETFSYFNKLFKIVSTTLYFGSSLIKLFGSGLHIFEKPFT